MLVRRTNDMKHIADYLKYAVLGLLIVVPVAGCTHSEIEVNAVDGQTTTVTFRPATRTRAGSDAENAIKTLRFIIMPAGLIPSDGVPAHFISYSATAEQIAAGKVEITKVPVGRMQIHVIANEAVLGKDYSTWENFSKDCVEVSGHDHQKLLIWDKERTCFPKKSADLGLPEDDAFLGLPMAWQNPNIEIYTLTDPPHTQEIPVELERSVAKLKVTMENRLGSEVNVVGMAFGAFFGDRFFLFREGFLDIPADAEYVYKEYKQEDSSLSGNINIPAGTSKDIVLYVYPSQAWISGTTTSPYAIGFKTDKSRYPLQSFVKDGNRLNGMMRNTQYNIKAIFEPTSVQLDFRVLPWEDKISDVPDFE